MSERNLLENLGPFFAGLACLLASCESPQPNVAPEPAYEYSFFVAGHTYGTPDSQVNGLFPPFLRMAPALSSDKNFELGVMPGDITQNGTTDEWEIVDRQLKQFKMPVYKVMGNHDARNRDIWQSRYGPSYSAFSHRSDLFVILDTNNPGWSVDAEQLDFLKNTLSAHTTPFTPHISLP